MNTIKQALIGRLYNKACRSLDDAELIRCLKDCCGPTRCLKAAQELRDTGRLTMNEIYFETVPNLFNWAVDT